MLCDECVNSEKPLRDLLPSSVCLQMCLYKDTSLLSPCSFFYLSKGKSASLNSHTDICCLVKSSQPLRSVQCASKWWLCSLYCPICEVVNLWGSRVWSLVILHKEACIAVRMSPLYIQHDRIVQVGGFKNLAFINFEFMVTLQNTEYFIWTKFLWILG